MRPKTESREREGRSPTIGNYVCLQEQNLQVQNGHEFDIPILVHSDLYCC